MTSRFIVDTDRLTLSPRYRRNYAVIDTTKLAEDGRGEIQLETDSFLSADDYAYQLNRKAVRK